MGSSYTFYQRFSETPTAFASGKSAAYSTGTAPALTGTVAINGTPRVGETLTASVSADTNNTGTLTFTWRNGAGESIVGESYSPSTADIGFALTVEVTSSVEGGMLTAVTAPVAKAVSATPPAPTLAAATSNSITLTAVAGCEYSSDNLHWQDSPAFANLTGGQTYTFYQRYKATDMRDASASSNASFTTTAGLVGTITVSGDVRFGKTLVASYTGNDVSTGASFVWYRGSTVVGYGTTYAVAAADIGYPLYVQLTSATQGNAITKLVGTAQRSEFIGNAPDAPTRESRSTSRVTLKLIAGYEYSMDGTTWKSSNVFSGLKSGKTYNFYQRVAATDGMDASPASSALRAATLSETTDDDDNSGGSTGGTTGGSTGGTTGGGSTDTGATGSGALYSYTVTPDSTRVLFSTMERLVTGNKTQDVTIVSGDTQFLFFKGTMHLTEGSLWYDFGTEINNAELTAAAKGLASDAVVATVRFNHSGELPAKANIRIKLGGTYAGKALYYYRLENNQLTYIQTAIADISGNVTVVQSSCSDYVFLDRDFYAADATPAPTVEPSASPTPAVVDEAEKQTGGKSWLGMLIIIIALLLIIVGIILYLKSRQSGTLDDFGEDDPDDDRPRARKRRRYLDEEDEAGEADDDEDDEAYDEEYRADDDADDTDDDVGYEEAQDAYSPYQTPSAPHGRSELYTERYESEPYEHARHEARTPQSSERAKPEQGAGERNAAPQYPRTRYRP